MGLRLSAVRVLAVGVLPLILAVCTMRPVINEPEIGNTQTDVISIHYTSLRDAFRTHDTNNDGYIDEHEYFQFRTDPTVARIRNSVPELRGTMPMLFDDIDENRDGMISDTEMTVILQPYLTR